jgi:hypothetical protein
MELRSRFLQEGCREAMTETRNSGPCYSPHLIDTSQEEIDVGGLRFQLPAYVTCSNTFIFVRGGDLKKNITI